MRTLGPGLLCATALLGALVLAGCGGGAAGSQLPSALPGKTTVHYPSFLPKNTLNPTIDATLIGTEAKPALQTEGLAIEAETKAFHVDVTVSGPIVPGEGLPDQPAATTWHLDRDDEGRQRQRARVHSGLPFGRPRRLGLPDGTGAR